jgi:predicted N-acetyltransferase YhbS
VKIRRAEPQDAATLTAIARAAKAAWGYPADWMAEWLPELTFTREYVSANEVFVATIDDEPVGVAVLHLSADGGSLEHVWIAPAHQGCGIGGRLVRRALSAATAHGLRTLTVASDPHAEAFYLKLGAQRTGSEPAPMPGSPERFLPVLEFRL